MTDRQAGPGQGKQDLYKFVTLPETWLERCAACLSTVILGFSFERMICARHCCQSTTTALHACPEVFQKRYDPPLWIILHST
jgi:hypothetical protein